MARARSVAFEARPAYSRLPHDDEKYVMKAFAKHASHCKQCSNPYQTHLAGETLCERGHRRALDVAQYVYVKAGEAFSVVDREARRPQDVQIEIPAGCDAVRSLLRAMDRGLRIARHQQKSEAKSMDRSYYVAPRPIIVDRKPSHRSAPKSPSASPPTSPLRQSPPTAYYRAEPLIPADPNVYYAPSAGYSAWPQGAWAAPAYPVAYVPRDRCRESYGYYAAPGYQIPRRGSTAIWS